MFTGFSPETLDFLWGIRMNNNREWFMAHKQQYVDYLYQPMKELGQEVFTPFLSRSGDLLKVSRIYKDARMHPTVPYKESLWLCIRRDVEWWAENPCLYLEINPDRIHYGFFFWKPKTAVWENFRRQIAARPEEFLTLIQDTQAAVGQPITAQCYKRPKPTDDPRLAPYFAWKDQIGCVRTIEPGEAMFGPQLAQEVRDFFTQLLPLYDYFNRITAI